MLLPRFLLRLSSPAVFMHWSGVVSAWALRFAVGLALAGSVIGFFLAPTDAQQGEVYRIIYLHVPAAWMSMFIYLVAGGYALLWLVFRSHVASAMLKALLPTGAIFTAVALVTGALWGRPTWGTYWVWDARLTSELILLFQYLGLMALAAAVEDPDKSDQVVALVALLGVVNLPVIYFSVQWWNTLHQGASVSLTRSPTMAPTMLTGMLLMVASAWCYSVGAGLRRAAALLAWRRPAADWAQVRFGENGP